MNLPGLQQQLEQLYEVSLPYSVMDFLITDRAVVNALEGDNEFDTREKLLIHDGEESLDLSLYIDASVLEKLSEDDPDKHLHAGNLDDYLITIEGVSHFIYMVWNAHHNRSVTLMELELQGEVDKYISAALTLMRQHNGRLPGGLRGSLFEGFRFNKSLDAITRRRYVAANSYASQYCRLLETRFLERRQINRHGGDLTTELRRFYRLTQGGKIQAIRNIKEGKRLCP